MSQEKRIPLSPKVRWRRVRSQTIPALSFLLAIVVSSILWRHNGAAIQGVGEVDSPQVDVTSPTAGLVLSLPNQSRGQWLVYDRVQAGDVIARIEDRQLEESENQLRREIMQLVDQIERRQADLAGEDGNAVNDAEFRAWQFEKSQLLSLDEQLAPTSHFTPAHQEAASSPPELPAAVPAVSRDALAKTRESRLALELRSKDLQRSTQSQEIHSPISGTLVAVHCWPGQTVPPGGRIATIAADYGRHIIGYIPEGSPVLARPGMQVTLRPRAAGSRRLTSQVEQVGRRVERIPDHQVAASKTPQWGTPVRIKMPSDALLQPGALVDVVFNNSSVQ